MDWFVRGSALATPGRTGGMHAEKGFHFQKSYAGYLLTRLLSGAEGISIIRYEGAQDVDLMLTDGRQVHVQVKKYDRTPLDVLRLTAVVESFVTDYRDAKNANGFTPADGLDFRLVAVGAVTDVAVLDIARRSNKHIHAPAIAKRISGKAKAPHALKQEVRAVLDRLETHLYPVGSPSDMYIAMAEAALVRFGVMQDRIDDALRALIGKIHWRENILASDVSEWLGPYLPPNHPASGTGAIRLVTGRTVAVRTAEAFYSSQATIWPAIFTDMDAPRDELRVLMAALEDPLAAKVLIKGPSGAGKSTLARRAAWNLAKQGRAMVLEVTDPTEAGEHWDAALKFAKGQAGSGRYTILLIDDLPDYGQLIRLAADLLVGSPLKVLGTTWRAGATVKRLGEGAIEVPIGKISECEAAGIASRLGRSLEKIPSAQLEPILNSGQLLLLNLVLLGEGSAESFARRILDRLREEAPELVAPYLDLCVFGRSDTSVPIAALLRRDRVSAQLLRSSEISGLVFEVGPHRLRSGHRLLSASVVAAAKVEPVERMIAIAGAADVSFERERRFAVGAIERVTSLDGLEAARASSKDISMLARRISSVGDYLDLRRTSQVLDRLGLEHQAKEIRGLATHERIRTGVDAAAYRADFEHIDPKRTFAVLIRFYDGNDTSWGWRNFLRFAANLDDGHLKTLALDQARGRLSRDDLEPIDGKVIADLVGLIDPPPNYAEILLIDILERFPGQMLVARAVAQTIISRVRSPTVFRVLLGYCESLIGLVDHQQIALVRNLTRAAHHAAPRDKQRWLSHMLSFVKEVSDPLTRAVLLHCSAQLADASHMNVLKNLIGPEDLHEHDELHHARHIIRRKEDAKGEDANGYRI